MHRQPCAVCQHPQLRGLAGGAGPATRARETADACGVSAVRGDVAHSSGGAYIMTREARIPDLCIPQLYRPVSFAIHCTRHETHTLLLSALGSVVLSHHANPEAEAVLLGLSGEVRMPQCLRWWRALQHNDALRDRIYTLARQGIDPLSHIRVIEEADGSITFKER